MFYWHLLLSRFTVSVYTSCDSDVVLVSPIEQLICVAHVSYKVIRYGPCDAAVTAAKMHFI